MPIRILIADDHRLLRAGLKTLLSTDANLEVVGESTSSDEALQAVDLLKPDILLMDVGMPGMEVLQAIPKCKAAAPETRILVLTMHEDGSLLQACIRAGASGYIIKRAAESELIDAIYAVWRGMIYIHPSLMGSLISPPTKPVQPQKEPAVEGLTSRELEILRYIVLGHTNRQISGELNISVRTVETHRSNIMEKLNMHSRVDLVRYATKIGLLNENLPGNNNHTD